MAEAGTILLAEDSADDVLLIQIACANAGVREHLEVVANGQQAIRYLNGQVPYADRAAHPFPSLLLLDLKMPAQDGFEVLEWLRQHPDLQRRLTTIILTGNPSPEAMARAKELGARSVLLKSLAFADLEASMRQLKQQWLDAPSRPQSSQTKRRGR